MLALCVLPWPTHTPFARLQDGLERACDRRQQHRGETEPVEVDLARRGQDHPDRDERERRVHHRAVALPGDQLGQQHRPQRRRRADALRKGDVDVPQRRVAAGHAHDEDQAQQRDRAPRRPRRRRLAAHEEGQRDAPKHKAGQHVQVGQERRVPEAVAVEDPLIQVGNRHVEHKPGHDARQPDHAL